MQDLRLVGVSDEGDYLLLAAPDATGADFRVPIDGRIRAAVRGETVRSGQLETQMESTVRPKEIQARIRAGQSPEEVAHAAGVSLERIEAFASPVVRERMHIVELAQRTAVRRPGESQPGAELGELVRQRLQARGAADDLEWDAWRRDDGTWKVRLHYKMANRTGTAEWIYDVSARHVRPVDDEAASLVSASGARPTPQEEPEEIHERPRLAAVGGNAEPPAAPAPPPTQPAQPVQEPLDQDHVTEPLRIARQQPTKSKRASVPSWDEIIFGTRRQD